MESTRGCLAIERGPLVYCIEAADNANVLDAYLDSNSELSTEFRPDVLGGVMTIGARGEVRDVAEWGGPFRKRQLDRVQGTSTQLRAIPYYAWANRMPGPMRVWLATT